MPDASFNWQGLAVAIILGLLGFIFGLVIRIGQQVHDQAKFREDHKEDIREVATKVRDLHRWHDSRDDDGVFSWYMRRSFAEKIADLAAAIVKLTERLPKQ